MKNKLLLLLVCILTAVWTYAQSGDCGANGDNVKWTFDSSTGILTISGEGEMADYGYYTPEFGIRNFII